MYADPADGFSSFAPLPPAGSDVFQPQLLGAEKVLWLGRPDPRRLLHRSDLMAMPFSLRWCGFAIF